MTFRQFLMGLMLTFAVAAPLSGCGKKSAPKPPSGDEAPYPGEYPSPS